MNPPIIMERPYKLIWDKENENLSIMNCKYIGYIKDSPAIDERKMLIDNIATFSIIF